mmetsp:Transcript_99043/g.171654  ORF Transcript_99043/g.171654 Transcript_99043/m.171654 type:complete len:286 (+) Transcript_99043:93-950(+)
MAEETAPASKRSRVSEYYAPLDIAGWTVLITGPTAGIGMASTWRFAELGCRLVLVGRTESKLTALSDELKAKYADLEVCCSVLDMQDVPKVQLLGEMLPDNFKNVDILVNNAGLALGRQSIDEVPMDDVMTMMNTNVMSLIACTKVFVDGMKARGRGHIINVGSTAGHYAYGGGSIYCATKSAVNAFSIAAMSDLVATPIRVTQISPGNVETNFSMTRFKGDEAKAKAVYADYVPLAPEDIADQIVYSATRPARVQIADIISWPTNQAAPTVIARVGPNFGAPSA